MVIGSATELRKLGEQLLDFASRQPAEFSDQKFPPLIASAPVHAPGYDFELSFHLDTQSQDRPPSNFPGRAGRKWAVLLLAGMALVCLTMLFFEKAFADAANPCNGVTDAKAATRVAEAALVEKYGKERVSEQLPLQVKSFKKNLWLVQGTLKGLHGPGGNFGVVIDKHSGCVRMVEYMK